jgi:hypothetical protein
MMLGYPNDELNTEPKFGMINILEVNMISSTRRVMRRIFYTYTAYPIYISISHNNY